MAAWTTGFSFSAFLIARTAERPQERGPSLPVPLCLRT